MTLLPEVEDALLTAIRAPHAARPRSRSRRRVLGPVVTVALACLAVAVTVGALVLLSGHRTATLTGPASHGAVPSGVPSAQRTLLQTLGVLRRPQAGRPIEMDKLLRAVINSPQSGPGRRYGRWTSDRAMLRSVAVPGTPYTAILAPIRPASRTTPASMMLSVALARRVMPRPANQARLDVVSAVTPISVAMLRDEGLLVMVDNAKNPGVLVVPDGVARIEIGPDLTLALTPSERKANPGLALSGRIAPVTAAVHANVAGLRLGGVSGHATGPRGLFLVPVRLPITWLAADGGVVSRHQVTTMIRVRLEPGGP